VPAKFNAADRESAAVARDARSPSRERDDRRAADASDADDEGRRPGRRARARLPPAEVGEVFAQVVSGSFDAEAEVPEGAEPPKRVLPPDPTHRSCTRSSRRRASDRGATWKT
jgi:hypothetical protein